MHPPEWICKELERLHPQLRLGWVGQERRRPDEDLNKGCFALIQLYHSRDHARTYFTPWHTVDNRGPVYGSRFDPLARFPIYLADIEPADVFSGACLPAIKRWMRPMKERYMESAKEKGKQYEAEVQDMAEGAADYMLWSANKPDSTSDRTVTNAEVTEYDKAVLRGEVKKDLTEAFTNTGNGMPLM